MKRYIVTKIINSIEVAEITININYWLQMTDKDILRIANRMLVLNNAKIRIKEIKSRTDCYKVSTDDECVTFCFDSNYAYITYHIHQPVFSLVET